MNEIIMQLVEHSLVIAFAYFFFLIILKLIILISYKGKQNKFMSLFWFAGVLIIIGSTFEMIFSHNYGRNLIGNIDIIIGLLLLPFIPIHPSKRLRWELKEVVFFFSEGESKIEGGL